jgi:hypothetical protein
VGAGLDEIVQQAECKRFRHPPRDDEFAAHAISMLLSLLEDNDRNASSREHRRQRTTCNAATDYHHIRC